MAVSRSPGCFSECQLIGKQTLKLDQSATENYPQRPPGLKEQTWYVPMCRYELYHRHQGSFIGGRSPGAGDLSVSAMDTLRTDYALNLLTNYGLKTNSLLLGL